MAVAVSIKGGGAMQSINLFERFLCQHKHLLSMEDNSRGKNDFQMDVFTAANTQLNRGAVSCLEIQWRAVVTRNIV